MSFTDVISILAYAAIWLKLRRRRAEVSPAMPMAPPPAAQAPGVEAGPAEAAAAPQEKQQRREDENHDANSADPSTEGALAEVCVHRFFIKKLTLTSVQRTRIYRKRANLINFRYRTVSKTATTTKRRQS